MCQPKQTERTLRCAELCHTLGTPGARCEAPTACHVAGFSSLFCPETAPMLVPKERTIVPLGKLVPSFATAFEEFTGERCEVIDAAIIYGKMVAECGHPNALQALWCWNIGNIRGRSNRGNYCLLAGAHEYVTEGRIPAGWHQIPNPVGHAVPLGKVAVLPDDARKQEFRAYDSIAEACREYVQVLGTRFGRAYRELAGKNTDPVEFVIALKAESWFTGPAAPYQRNVAGVALQVIEQCEEILGRSAQSVAVPEPSRLLMSLYHAPPPVEIPAVVDFLRTLEDEGPKE